jgi:hypothetical protein
MKFAFPAICLASLATILCFFNLPPAAGKSPKISPPQPTTTPATIPAAIPAAAEAQVEEIVFCERNPSHDYEAPRRTKGHYYANFGYACLDPTFCFYGEGGAKLCKLNLKTRKITIILNDPKGSIRDPQVHYDAKKILFSYRKGETRYFNLYEINIDGTHLKQLTTGPWDDIEPTYLPDGGIAFSSSRCKRFICCWVAPTANMHRCEGDGSNIRMLSSGADAENTPSVLPDGRILYTRWEYVNRDPILFHHLWTMNPDGTSQQIYFGNMHPGGVFIDAKAIPNTNTVAFILSPAHGVKEHAGTMCTVTNALGPDHRKSIKSINPIYHRDKSIRDIYPLSNKLFLAAKGKSILLVPRTGKLSVLYSSKMMVHEPSPLRKRTREKVIPHAIDLSKDYATLMLNNAYIGRNMKGIKPGAIKKLLIMEDLPKPVNFHGGGSRPISHGVSSTLKRILGTVPVEADGSASFKVPPLRSIYFVALDENDLCIKQMRSFVTLQPGETLSCIGCHEERTKAPSAKTSTSLMAFRRPASEIAPIADVPEIIDFPRDIQPVLDRYCVTCHNHEKRKGGVNLTGDRGPAFSHSYYSLILQWQVKDTAGAPINESGRQMGNDKPYACFSYAAPLMKKLDGSHHKVKPSKKDKRIIRLWLDSCNPYAGTYAAFGTGQIGGCWGWNKPVREMDTKWPSTKPAKEAITRRCGACHGKEMPKHVTDVNVPRRHGDMLSWTRPMSRFSKHYIFNLTHPDKSLVLLTPLARMAGGYAKGEPKIALVKTNHRVRIKPIVHPVIFKNTTDPDYQKILVHITAAKNRLNTIKRFDMPGFKPIKHYVREMKRFGILSPTFDLAKDPIDVYKTDKAYWKSMHHKPTPKPAN